MDHGPLSSAGSVASGIHAADGARCDGQPSAGRRGGACRGGTLAPSRAPRRNAVADSDRAAQEPSSAAGSLTGGRQLFDGGGAGRGPGPWGPRPPPRCQPPISSCLWPGVMPSQRCRMASGGGPCMPMPRRKRSSTRWRSVGGNVSQLSSSQRWRASRSSAVRGGPDPRQGGGIAGCCARAAIGRVQTARVRAPRRRMTLPPSELRWQNIPQFAPDRLCVRAKAPDTWSRREVRVWRDEGLLPVPRRHGKSCRA